MSSTLTRSPLDRVFDGVESVPYAFREQFLLAPEDGYEVILEGTMSEITYPTALVPLFWLLGRVGMLVPRRGRNVPASLHVVPGRMTDGTPYHEWNRTFEFKPAIHFDTTIVWDRAHDNLADLVGRPRMLRMVWAARFTAPQTFTLRSIANGITVGRRTLWLPRWAWRLLLGSVEFTQIADDADSNRVSIELRVVHPVGGTVFEYRGAFRTRRIAKAGLAT